VLEERLALARRLRDATGEVLALTALGEVRLAAGQPDRAIQVLEEAVAAAERSGSYEALDLALASLGLAHEQRGDEASRLAVVERRLAAARGAGNQRVLALALRDLAHIRVEQGDLGRAVEPAEESLRIARATADGEQEVLALELLGSLYFASGDLDRATEHYEAGATAARRRKDRRAEARALLALSGVLLSRGEIASAAPVVRQALGLTRWLGDADLRAAALETTGLLALARGDLRSAAQHWQIYLDHLRRPRETATARADRGLEVLAMGQLARVVADLGEPARAEELARGALDVARAERLPSEEAHALGHLAYVRFRAGRLEEAEADVRAAAERFERLREGAGDEAARIGVLDLYSPAHDLWQQILVRRGEAGKALEVAERSRARAFAEALATREGGPAPSTEDAEDAPPDLERIVRVARQSGATLVEYSLLHDPAGLLAAQRLQGAQPALEEELVIWVVRPDGRVDVRTVDLRALRARSPSMKRRPDRSAQRPERASLRGTCPRQGCSKLCASAVTRNATRY
jgi:tetratricopeptide (TPR) repeat protein